MATSTELCLLGGLLLLNGLLVAAEIAVVASRKSRLRVLAAEGRARAQALLDLLAAPGRFLSILRGGIALTIILAGALVGGPLAARLASVLARVPALAAVAPVAGFVLAVAGLALALLVAGELAPKRLALSNPERTAMLLAGPVNLFARLLGPLILPLAALTDFVLKPLRLKQRAVAPVSDEEVNILVEQGLRAGVFQKAEREMVAGVLELDSLPVTALMTPRPKLVFLNLDDPEETNWRRIVASGHSHFPVCQGGRDQVLGMIAVKALWAQTALGVQTSLKNLLFPAPVVPETMAAIQLLEQFKKTGKHIALVADEFGSIQGLVTLIDVMEAIVGDLPTPLQRHQPEARRRDDGSWLVDATLPVNEAKALLRVDGLPAETEADYQTLGGFVVTQFGRIPAAGDHFDWAGWRFEVADMDRHRVDKLIISRAPPAAPAAQKAAS